MPAHVIDRGINRMTIFQDTQDHEYFLAILRAVARVNHLFVHSYVLMTNHYHAVATPASPQSLPLSMQKLNGEYVRYFNKRYRRMGTLWNSRYKGILITDEYYLLNCIRYVEQNPVRAGMVSRPEDYPWSSYRFHAFGEPSPWLKPHPVYLALGATPQERQMAYRELCGAPLTEAELVEQRRDASGCP